ncbi:hypothetical protein DDB_G0286689 [Dictyostelium discoideum AX4]|uniref:Uncharacterized protein n=1 Tax=Dictyostelium discoideum TaxID=44689 RepID=Q54LD7_DICDI|nr:hypothetical protein DDB_G0286689 [Dictyostelium discoideum AX4]EAL64100.1 hypothetical protein DDB_G0286689 [Dictyostelium discoideum AX4]|eukprot:XP_637624.1 hypothetical protein DDB_G0286689 [Dictyostelium discoideum AX4]
MTLISSISKISSVNINCLNNTISNGVSSQSLTSYGGSESTSLVNADIMANLLGILGIRIKAEVL